MCNGATLSHHHAVGYQRPPWLSADVWEQGVLAFRA
jgi:hypothetical protein